MAAACHSLKKRGFSAIKLSDFIAVAVLYTLGPCDPCLHLLQASSRNLPLPPNQQRKFYFLLLIRSLNHITSARKLFEKKNHVMSHCALVTLKITPENALIREKVRV